MSEVVLTEQQLRQAVQILWHKDQIGPFGLRCDDDDVHEYLVESGLLKQDHHADLGLNPDAYQWLSDESLEKLYTLCAEVNYFGKRLENETTL